MEECTVGIDVGGTKIHIALAKQLTIIAETNLETRADEGGEKCLGRIVQEVLRLTQEKNVVIGAVAMAVPGAVHPITQRTSFTWNIPGWDELDVRDRLEKSLRAPVLLDNDANFAALAESTQSALESPSIAFIAVGTGVGAGIVLNGSIWRGKSGTAGEIARWVMSEEGLDKRYHDTGHLEFLASGSGIKARYEQQSGLLLTGSEVALRSKSGDDIALEVMNSVARSLAIAAANLATALDLDEVVFGGGVFLKNQENWLPMVRDVVRENTLNPPTVLVSRLGSHAVVTGCLIEANRMASGSASRPTIRPLRDMA